MDGTAIISVVGGVLTLTSGGLAAYVLYRSKNAEVIKGEMDAWKGKAERLDKDFQTLVSLAHEKDVEIEGLKARTDLSEIRKGQAAIIELIAKQSAAILENQMNGMKIGQHVESALTQMVATMEKMEQRLNQGLIMK